jgi:hypothetical protein
VTPRGLNAARQTCIVDITFQDVPWMQKTVLMAVLLLTIILALLLGSSHTIARPQPYAQPEGCAGRLELASEETLVAGSPIGFYFTNEGGESITLRSTAPWLIREASPEGPVIDVPVSAGVIQEVGPGKRYPVSEAWSWTPDREGDYYIQLSYECAGAYPLLAYLHLKVFPVQVPEFPGTLLLVLVAVAAIGVALTVVRYRPGQKRETGLAY